MDRNRTRWVAAAFILSLAAFACRPGESARPAERNRAKNVILMISDGCGYKHVEATDLYTHGEPNAQVYGRFPVVMGMRTPPMRNRGTDEEPVWEQGDYDPERAWTDFEYVRSGVTDSAASATAIATGVKTYNGALSVDVEIRRLETVLEKCEKLRMATGVVSSVPFAHATPAAFVAHNVSRGAYSEIARAMIEGSTADCIMGGGHPYYDADGQRLEEAGGFDSVGDEALWKRLQAGTAGAWNPALDDANGNGRPDPGEWQDADHNRKADDAWVLVESRADFQRLMSGDTPKRVIGIPQVAGTLQERRSGDGDAAPFEVPLIESVPTLVEMTRAALNVLDDDPDGLFLMIEGGAVDWAGHRNQPGRTIEEQIDFNRAVDAVVEWVENNSSWDETLLIVTADHETGYLTAGEGVFANVPLRNNGVGKVPGMAWNSGGHTNSLVPLYAEGRGAEAFLKRTIGEDPVRGDYVDNTDIAHVICEALGVGRPSGAVAEAR